MIFLIFILFISEIIIATTIIVGLVYFDKKITTFNDKIMENRYQIKADVENVKLTVNKFFKMVKEHGEKLIEKERNFIYNIIKSLVLGIVFLLVSKKRKKQILMAELLMITFETFKNRLEA